MNYREFAQKIKTRYPDYGDMDDRDLAQKMVQKFPEYSDVSFDETPTDSPRIGVELPKNLGTETIAPPASTVQLPKDVSKPAVTTSQGPGISYKPEARVVDLGQRMTIEEPAEVKPAEFGVRKSFVQGTKEAAGGIAQAVATDIAGDVHGAEGPRNEFETEMYSIGKTLVDSKTEPKDGRERQAVTTYKNIESAKKLRGFGRETAEPVLNEIAKKLREGDPEAKKSLEDAQYYFSTKDALDPRNAAKTFHAAATLAANSAAQTAASMVPGVGTAALIGSEQGNWIDQAKNAGLDNQDVLRDYSIAYGLLSGGIEQIGGEIATAPLRAALGGSKKATDKVLQIIGKNFGKKAVEKATKDSIRKVVSKTVGDYLGSVIIGAIGEGVEEYGQDYISDALLWAAFDQAAERNPDRASEYLQKRDQIDLNPALKKRLEAAKLGAIAGGFMRGTTTTAGKAIEAVKPKPEVSKATPSTIAEPAADIRIPKEPAGKTLRDLRIPSPKAFYEIPADRRTQVFDQLTVEDQRAVMEAYPTELLETPKVSPEAVSDADAQGILKQAKGIPQVDVSQVTPEEQAKIGDRAAETLDRMDFRRKQAEKAVPREPSPYQAQQPTAEDRATGELVAKKYGLGFKEAVEGDRDQGGVRLVFTDPVTNSEISLFAETADTEAAKLADRLRQENPEAYGKQIATAAGVEFLGKKAQIARATGAGKYETEIRASFKTPKGNVFTVPFSTGMDEIRIRAEEMDKQGAPDVSEMQGREEKTEAVLEPRGIRPNRDTDRMLAAYVKTGKAETTPGKAAHQGLIEVFDQVTPEDIADAVGISPAEAREAIGDIRALKKSEVSQKVRQVMAPSLFYGQNPQEVIDGIRQPRSSTGEVMFSREAGARFQREERPMDLETAKETARSNGLEYVTSTPAHGGPRYTLREPRTGTEFQVRTRGEVSEAIGQIADRVAPRGTTKAGTGIRFSRERTSEQEAQITRLRAQRDAKERAEVRPEEWAHWEDNNKLIDFFRNNGYTIEETSQGVRYVQSTPENVESYWAQFDRDTGTGFTEDEGTQAFGKSRQVPRTEPEVRFSRESELEFDSGTDADRAHGESIASQLGNVKFNGVWKGFRSKDGKVHRDSMLTFTIYGKPEDRGNGSSILAPLDATAGQVAKRRVEALKGVVRFQIEEPRQQADTFFSPTLKAVQGLKQERGTGDQMFAMITKTPGVKEAEWKWMGLDDFLKGKQSVTRQEIEEFVRGNQVRVEEVERGGKERRDLKIERSWKPNLFNVVDSDGNIIKENVSQTTASETVDTYWEGKGDTKYSQYSLPGGENYREVLLTLPVKKGADELPLEWRKNRQDLWAWFKGDKQVSGAFKEYDARNAAMPTITSKPLDKNRFKSSHWDEPNVIAHIRLDDRTGPNGEKVLFVDEIQSDWAREAREKGVRPTSNKSIDDLNKRRLEIEAKGKDATTEEKQEWAIAMSIIEGKGVPAQPFLKNWEELTLKRVLRMAAEEGYDRVAWINGEQTAARYDLSKQISNIRYNPENNKLIAFSDDRVVIEETVSPEKLSDYIGKEPAKKLLETPTVLTGGGARVHLLEGPDLKIGGEWAINLYDRMIPKFYEKYGKKWGTKVEEVSIGKGDSENEASLLELSDGTYAIDYNGDRTEYDTEQAARSALKEIRSGQMVQQSIPITPEMKESVLYEGQPMFQKDLRRERPEAVPQAPGRNLQTTEGQTRQGEHPNMRAVVALEGLINRSLGEDLPENSFTAVDAPKTEAHQAVDQLVPELFGRPVAWFQQSEESKSEFSFGGAVTSRPEVFINVDTRKPVMVTAVHEGIHIMRQEHPDLYQELVRAAVEQGTSEFESYRQQIMDRGNYEAEISMEETLAEISGERFTDPEFLRGLAERSPEAFRRFVEIMQDVIKRITDWIRRSNIQHAAKYFRELDRFDQALQDALIEMNRRQRQPMRMAAQREVRASKEVQPEDKNLVALHNIGENDLLNVDKFGGMAVPSIGITKKDKAYEGFGQITLIGDKDLVDPSKPYNPVFSSDVYSPTVPPATYRVNKKTGNKFVDDMNTVGYRHYKTGYGGDIESAIKYGNRDKFLSAAEHDDLPKALFLKENGVVIDLPMRKVSYASDFTRLANSKAMMDYYEKNPTFSSDVLNDPKKAKELAAAMKRGVYEVDPEKDVRKLAFENLFDEDGKPYFGPADRLHTAWYNEKTGAMETDRRAFSDNLDAEVEKIGKEKFVDWIDKKADEIFHSPYIDKKGKPEYNLENIVDAITSSRTVGSQKNMTFGINQAKSFGSKMFKSIEDIKAATSKLTDYAIYEKAKDKAEKAFFGVTDRMSKYYEFARPGEISFDRLNDAARSLANYYRGGKTVENMQRSLRKNGYKEVPDYIAEEFMKVAQELIDNPVVYFEAKPQRSVKISEFKGAIIPKGTSQKVRDILDKNGIKYVEYDRSVEGDRAAKVQQFSEDQDLAFSRERTDQNKKSPEAMALSNLFEEAKKYDNIEAFSKDFKVLYHGGSEKILGNKLVTGGRVVGEVTEDNLGKGQDYGGIFFTPERQLAETFRGHASGGTGKVHSFVVKTKNLFDERNARDRVRLQNFVGKKYTEDGEEVEFTKQMYDFVFPMLDDKKRHMDWATFNPNILEAMGYEGANVIENYGDDTEGPLFSTVLFKGGKDSPHWRIPDNWNIENVFNEAQKGEVPDIRFSRERTDQTQTPEFKAWFGDSKVVDAEGKPLVVYKGMPVDDYKTGQRINVINRESEFPAFNSGEKGTKIAGFFSSDPKVASRFAMTYSKGGEGNAVFPAYLSFKNPFTIDAKGDLAGNIEFGKSGQQFRDAIRSGKYDGIIIKNTKDEGDVYVAFSPTQIKSATGNRGTFDPENPDIRFSRERADDEGAFYVYRDRYDNAVKKTVSDALSGKKERQQWDILSPERMVKIWQDYSRTGVVRDERGIDDILDDFMDKITTLDANTNLAAHTENDPAKEIERVTGENVTEKQLETIQEYITTEDGTLRISDYGLSKLSKLVIEATTAKTYEEKLLLIDQMLNVVHQRSDLAGWFVDGGRKALDKLSGNVRFSRERRKIEDATGVSQPEIMSKEYRATELRQTAQKLRRKLRKAPQSVVDSRADLELRIRDMDDMSRETVQAAIIAYADYIGLSDEPRNQVIRIVRRSRTPADLRKAVESMDAIVERRNTSALFKRATEAVAETFVALKRAQGKTRSTVDAEANRQMQEYVKGLMPETWSVVDEDGRTKESFGSLEEAQEAAKADEDLRVVNDNERAEKIVAYWLGAGKETRTDVDKYASDLGRDVIDWIDGKGSIPQSAQNIVNRIIRRGLEDRSNPDLLRVIRDLHSIRKFGRTAYMAQEAQRKAKETAEAKEAIAEIKQHTPVVSKQRAAAEATTEAQKKRKKRDMGKLKRYGYGLLSAETIMEKMSGWKPNPRLKQMLYYPFYKAATAEARAKKGIVKFFRDTYGNDVWRMRTEPLMDLVYEEKQAGKEEPQRSIQTLTVEQAMGIYSHSKDPGQRRRLLMTIAPDNLEFAEAQVDAVSAALPEKYRKMVESQWDYYYENQYNRINPVYREEHNIDMPRVRYYMPLGGLNSDPSTHIAEDVMERHVGKAATQKGMTVSRTATRMPLANFRYFDMVLGNMQKVEHYIAFNKAVRQANRYMANKDLLEAMDAHSPVARQNIEEWINAMARGTAMTPEREDSIDPLINWMRNVYSVYQLGGKLTSMAMQVSALPRGLAFVKPRYAMKALGEIARHPVKSFEMIDELSPIFEERISNWDMAVTEFAESSENQKIFNEKNFGDQWAKIRDFTMYGIGYLDKKVAGAVWLGKYMETLDKETRVGKSESEAMESAISAADEIVRKTQQGGGLLNSSKLERGSAFARAITQFMSENRKTLQMAYEYASKFPKMSNKERASIMALAFIAPSVVVWFIRNGFRPDEPEEILNQSIQNIAAGLPVLGIPVQMAAQKGIDVVTEKITGVPKQRARYETQPSLAAPYMSMIEVTNRAIQGVPEGDWMSGINAGLQLVPAGKQISRSIDAGKVILQEKAAEKEVGGTASTPAQKAKYFIYAERAVNRDFYYIRSKLKSKNPGEAKKAERMYESLSEEEKKRFEIFVAREKIKSSRLRETKAKKLERLYEDTKK